MRRQKISQSIRNRFTLPFFFFSSIKPLSKSRFGGEYMKDRYSISRVCVFFILRFPSFSSLSYVIILEHLRTRRNVLNFSIPAEEEKKSLLESFFLPVKIRAKTLLMCYSSSHLL